MIDQVGLASAVSSVLLHKEQIADEYTRNSEEVAQHAAFHKASCEAAQARHEQQQRQRLAYHRASLSLQLDIARRDAIRDASRHKGAAAQCYVTVASVVFGSLLAIVYQLSPPKGSGDGALATLAALIAGSALLLLVCVRNALLLSGDVCAYRIHMPLHVYQPCGQTHTSFNSYFACHCAWAERWAVRALYSGIVLTLASGGLYQFLSLVDDELREPLGSAPGGDHAGIGPAVVFGFFCAAAAVVVLFAPVLAPARTREGVEDLTGAQDRGSMGEATEPF